MVFFIVFSLFIGFVSFDWCAGPAIFQAAAEPVMGGRDDSLGGAYGQSGPLATSLRYSESDRLTGSRGTRAERYPHEQMMSPTSELVQRLLARPNPEQALGFNCKQPRGNLWPPRS